MRLGLFLFALVGMGCSVAIAQESAPPAPALYRMSKADFLALAGDDDSLRAVVNLYFRKRKTASTFITAGMTTLGVFVVGSLFTVLGAAGSSGDSGDEITTFAAIAGATFYGSATVGVVRLARYPRKRLQEVITERQAGRLIPSRLRKKLRAKDFAN